MAYLFSAYETGAGWLTFVVLVAGSFWFGRVVKAGQAGAAIQVLEAANRVLTAEVARLQARVTELERTHTIVPVLQDVAKLREDAVTRGDQVIGLLEKIAERQERAGGGAG